MSFDQETQQRIDLIRRNWDERAGIHFASAFYGIGERDPLTWILPFEWHALGELAGRDVAHLQCHLGVETMALARKGARVTGLDISGHSVQLARVAAADAGLDIEYVHADVHQAAETLGEGRFDVVYTGKGALCYLPDLDVWADIVRRLLRPGGFAYIVEFHPLLHALGPAPDPADPAGLTLRHDYLDGRGAVERDSSHTYTDGPALSGNTLHYEWTHGLGEVVTALARAGLTIESLTESDAHPAPRWPWMTRDELGWWRQRDPDHPLVATLYGLKAGKPR